MRINTLCPSGTRLTGSFVLLAAFCGTVQAMSVEELAAEKLRLQQQGTLNQVVRLAAGSAGAANPLQAELVSKGIDTPEALKSAFDAAWQNRQVGIDTARPRVQSSSTVSLDPVEHARLKALAHEAWEARRPDASGREVPTNDLCGNATNIGDGSWPYATVEAGRELPELICDNWGSANAPDVWFRYVAGCSGTVTFSICDSNFDSNLHAWDACGGSILACNEDFCGDDGFSAELNLAVSVGEDYLIQLSGYNGQSGYGNLVVTTSCTVPANETCATAIPVGVGRIPFYTLPGTPDENVGCGYNPGGDIWYVWTPGCDGNATFSTCDDANFDTMIAIWTACGGTELACNDDNCFLQSSITLGVSAGTSYYIQLMGYNGQTGYGGLTIDANIANDACADATPISGPGSWEFCTTDAGIDGLTYCQYTASGDVWYLYTAECASLVTFTTCGATPSYDTVIGLYDACGGNLLICDDDYFDGSEFPCSANSRVDRYMLQGEQVWVLMTGYDASTGVSTLTVNTTCYNPPNDLCQLALPLVEGMTNFTTVGASTDGPVEAALCSNFGDSNVGADIWYTYTAATSGIVTISLQGADYDTKMAVYAGSCPSVESAIACNDDFWGLDSQVEFATCAGQNFTVRIGGYDGGAGPATGSGPLSLTLAPAVTPLAPQNLQIQLLFDWVLLSWDPVVSTELGCPLSGVVYTVLAADANGNSWPLGSTYDTVMSLPGEVQNNVTRTYRVTASSPFAAATSSVPVVFNGNSVIIDSGKLSK